MAFSTQKDFFHVPFMDQNVEYECMKSCVKLKSYKSSIDDRSWTGDEIKQSKFLSDLVTCQFPVERGSGDGDRENVKVEDTEGDNLMTQLGALTTGDSLLECTNIHLEEYQKLMNINTSLEKQLENSNERLETVIEENNKIKEIFNSKLDSNTANDFYNKIQKLIAVGKLGKTEEKDMLQIYQKMENMCKSYEVLQAENCCLKRLIEKLETRVTLDKIELETEKSTDVNFLQKQVNILRKECLMLRQIEDEYLKSKQKCSKPDSVGISEQDADNIKGIIKERNSLREKCKSLRALEEHVHDLEKKASEAGKLAKQLSGQTLYINQMEDEMQNMQQYYEGQHLKACSREKRLKAQIEDLKDDLVKAKCLAQKADMLSMEVGCLRNEVLKRDLAISDYDCQYKQLMDVVDELQAVKLQSLQDNQTQTFKNETEELAFYTSATLNEIMKELKKKGSLNDEFMAAYGLGPAPNDTDAEYNRECCAEMYRLQKQVEDMQKKFDEAADCDAICAEALKRLKDLEAENAKLLQDLENSKQDKDILNQKLKEGEEKMANMLAKIERLDNEINRTAQEANRIGKDLEGTMGLVKDISDVQLQNQQLTNAVSAINSRDDQKIIDDLRRQLEEELFKLNKCQQHNDTLLKEAKERENDLKKLKDLNNKLQADKRKLEEDKKKLQDDNNDLLNALNDPEGNKKGNNENITETELSDIKDLKNTSDNKKNIEPNKSDNDSNENIKNFNNSIKNDDIKKPIDHRKKAAALSYVGQRDEAAALDDSFAVNKAKPKGEAVASRKDFINKSPTRWNGDKAAAIDDFVHKKSESIKFNLYKGKCFEKEICKILDEFIQEYGFCLCRLAKPKRKLYDICHKLLQHGIGKLLFAELVYLHNKIYDRAEQLMPGCLWDMILENNKGQTQNMLNKANDKVRGGNFDLKLSDRNLMYVDKKCCCCKTELCCNNSDEMLKDKVDKLEKDIEIAREYLEALKNLPIDTGLQSEYGVYNEDADNDNLTYRASSPMVVVQQKSSGTKHLKKLKTLLYKNPDIYHA